MAKTNRVARAEPSRGAPQVITKLRATRDAYHNRYGVPISHEYAEFLNAIGDLAAGHVVLLEALRPFADLMDEEGLAHMEECHFGSGDFVIQAADIRRARAAIQQAERT